MRVKVIRCPSMSILIQDAVNDCIQELESKGHIVTDIKLSNEMIMVIYEERIDSLTKPYYDFPINYCYTPEVPSQSNSYQLTTANDTNNYVGDFVVTVG